MHSIQLLSSILKGKWLLDYNFAASQGSIIASIINKESQFNSESKIEPDEMTAFAVSGKEPGTARYSWYRGFDMAQPGSVAVIKLFGALMKEDQWCGGLGMASIGQIIEAADSHHNIDAIVLHVDSPGGTVDGTETLANIVRNTKKPIVTFVDGLMASAALWIGSSTDETIASTDTDEIGSVGVLMSFMDIQPYWEEQGVKFHTITASTSPEKVKMWEDLRAGKYEAYIKEVLDPLDEKFMNTIKNNCPEVEDQHLTGKVFFARDVMGVFVDSIGTLSSAVSRAYALAHPEEEDDDSNSNNSNNKNSMKQFEKLNGVLGVNTLESQDEQVSLNEEQLELVEGALSENEQAVAAARLDAETERDAAFGERDTAASERDTAIEERDTARTELSNATSAFDSIDETIASAETPEAKAEAIRTLLAAQPGAKPEGNLDNEDPNASVTAEEDWDTIDSLPHNQAVDQNL
ncbi:S49 family peptidase [Prolixibacteraceae bacterium Z1-6]|uniref:S49 family peptidase n=1 Tax=Draconibacterium aestuarii TaxID=2998507 RepID=A0A9X3J702_9BACT|nr:S49 family peptidase [Prolixibacteraceae bacterium Z1-6]